MTPNNQYAVCITPRRQRSIVWIVLVAALAAVSPTVTPPPDSEALGGTNGIGVMQTVYVACLPVQRSPHPMAPFVQHVRVDHDGPHVFVAQELLHSMVIAAIELQVICRRKGIRADPASGERTQPNVGAWQMAIASRIMRRRCHAGTQWAGYLRNDVRSNASVLNTPRVS